MAQYYISLGYAGIIYGSNEYRSRVFSLVAHVKKIADFQTEILENDELRLSKIAQLDSLEEGVGVWGVINLLEGYGNDNPGAKSQGIKQLMSGGGIIIVAQTVIPQLTTLFS